MKLGAYDFLQKPVDATRLRTILANATRQRETEDRAGSGSPPPARNRRPRLHGGQLQGHARDLRTHRADRALQRPVLITGESGTGKELVARTLHDLSPRKAKPFVASTAPLFLKPDRERDLRPRERRLHRRSRAARRLLRTGPGGTLLLDEIGEMPAATQAKLLRVLEERKLRRLGARTSRMWTCACWPPPTATPTTAVAEGHLRADLFYRLNVFNIHMPPLRDHMEDLPAMAEAMLGEMNQKHNRRVSGVAPSMLDRMMAYDWPGNAPRTAQHHRARGDSLSRRRAARCRHLPPGFAKQQPRPPCLRRRRGSGARGHHGG
jgi:DNA-binding NtrC family response regulator